MIIFGLGNPGERYTNTRHNAGFMIVNALREKWDFPAFEFNKKFNAEVSQGIPPFFPEDSRDKVFLNEKNKLVLVKPQPFMNNSGQSVRAILDFYKLTPKDILVIHDEIDINLGRYKLSEDSRAAGHNGVEDIIEKLGTKEFRRMRIGVATDDLRTRVPAKEFVLQNFSKEEKDIIEKIVPEVTEEIEKIF